MDSLKVLHKKLNDQQVSDALTNDLVNYAAPSLVVVITDRPYILLSVVRKRWLKRLRKMRIQRAQLLAGPEASQLTSRIMTLEALRFVAGHVNHPEANLTFATAEDLMHCEHSYRVMYITCELPPVRLRLLTSRMPRDGLAIIYEK